MTLTYDFRNDAETMASVLADRTATAMAVFTKRVGRAIATCVCPLSELRSSTSLIAIYDPRA